eukprot:1301951-Rhodomonas_salina.2
MPGDRDDSDMKTSVFAAVPSLRSHAASSREQQLRHNDPSTSVPGATTHHDEGTWTTTMTSPVLVDSTTSIGNLKPEELILLYAYCLGSRNSESYSVRLLPP